MKTRILIRAGYLSLRGEALSTFQLIRELVARGYSVGVVSNGGPLHERLGSMGASMMEVNRLRNNLFLDAFSLRREAALVRSFSPQLIHVQSQSLDRVGAMAARLTRTPYLLTIRAFLRGGRKLSYSRRWGRGIVFVSEEVRQVSVNQNRAPKEFTTVIPDGVIDGGEQPPVPDGRVKVVGVITPVRPLRGLNYFLEAAREIRDSGLTCRFLIAGEGPQEEEIRKEIRILDLEDSFTLVHPLSPFSEVIRSIDIFVFPSIREGLGLLPMYAMAHGLPVVASSVGGILSLIADGETGLLVPSRNSSALAEKIRYLLENEEGARELGEAGRRYVLENFALSKSVDRLEELYKKAVEDQV